MQCLPASLTREPDRSPNLRCVPQNLAAPKPANLDFVQAASVPMVGLTSWQALKERAQLKQGQKVFIPAGSGGIDVCDSAGQAPGAHVGTTTSTGNVLVTHLGADEVVDYTNQAFEQVLRGCHVVLEPSAGMRWKNRSAS
jgi:NADPH:quinone reductase-like Zn-dependent oxidoreductase